MRSKNRKIMILQVGEEPYLVRNQVTQLSSRYFWPLPWTDKSLSLIVLSTNLIRQFTSLACSPCRREFLSLHTICTTAWNVYRTRKSLVGVSLGLEKIINYITPYGCEGILKQPPNKRLPNLIWLPTTKE